MVDKIFKYLIIIAGLFLAGSSPGQNPGEIAAPPPTTRILFVFDASQSMYGRWQSDMKIHIAQRLLSKVLDSLSQVENLELALRVYGHQKPIPPQDCNDTRLEVPFGKNNANKIKNRLSQLNPKGTTPIAYALEQSQYDFTHCDDCRNIIVLITDGVEECGGDPCEVSRMLQKKGIVLKPFVIDIGNDVSESLNCVGNYYNAASEKAFSKALNIVITQALNATTAQVNLLDESGRPSETNVNMTFYDSYSGNVKYNFVHTMNHRGLPDTLVIDHLLNYDVVVHTIPEIRKDSVNIHPGKHTVIPINAPQGSLNLTIGGNWRTIRNLQAIVRKHGQHETLNIQHFGTSEKYLTGTYDLEVLALPRFTIDNVVVNQSTTTTIEIPLPGIVTIRKIVDGYGSLYVEDGNELKLIYNLDISKDGIENLVLQPGNYRIIFRSKYADKSAYTFEEKFVIESGRTVEIKLNR